MWNPAKQNKIQGFLDGFLGKEFVVRASFGHIRDLPSNDLNIDVANNFNPTYEISSSKTKQVRELKNLAKNSEIVWLATDDDREGEAIAWHLAQTIIPSGIDNKRIIFHEITKKAVRNALQNPRDIDMNVFYAQQMRRILDRIIGYGQSEVLWKAMQNAKSSGRVQSIVSRIIVEKEREIEAYEPSMFISVGGVFCKEGSEENFNAEYKGKLDDSESALLFLNNCKESDFTVSNIEKKETKRKPPVPYVTSTLQQEASSLLKMNSKITMQHAQKLYEGGHITYMRTDSTILSDEALQMCKDVILEDFGENYYQARQFKMNAKNAQEAHECIRPTKMDQTEPKDITGPCLSLYRLILKRTIASQMKDCLVDITTVTIKGSKITSSFKAKGEIIKFDGFKKKYMVPKIPIFYSQLWQLMTLWKEAY